MIVVNERTGVVYRLDKELGGKMNSGPGRGQGQGDSSGF